MTSLMALFEISGAEPFPQLLQAQRDTPLRKNIAKSGSNFNFYTLVIVHIHKREVFSKPRG